MAFKINKSGGGGVRVTLDERVWLTRDGDLVGEGHPRAAILYCAAGRSVLRADYEARCAVKAPKDPISRRDSFRTGDDMEAKAAKVEKAAKAKAAKAKKAAANKAKPKAANKGKGE